MLYESEKIYYCDDKLYRSGQVKYYNGDKYYYVNNKLHREDGPAIDCADGDQYYYLNDEIISQIAPSGVKYSEKEMLTVLKLIMFA